MSVSVKNNLSSGVRVILLAMPVFLSGCVPVRQGDMTQVCRNNCQFSIELPDDKQLPPKVPEEFYRVTGSTLVNFTVPDDSDSDSDSDSNSDSDSDSASTLLVFEKKAAFVDGDGKKIYVLRVNPGKNGNTYKTDKGNTYKTVKYDEYVKDCPPKENCNKYKYTIVNHGTPERPPLDPWIIIEQ